MALVSRDSSSGSSLRAQGTLGEALATFGKIRFIPAGAGNTHDLVEKNGKTGGSSLRAQGTRWITGGADIAGRFILRAQGTLTESDIEFGILRFIPAGAGNTAAPTA